MKIIVEKDIRDILSDEPLCNKRVDYLYSHECYYIDEYFEEETGLMSEWGVVNQIKEHFDEICRYFNIPYPLDEIDEWWSDLSLDDMSDIAEIPMYDNEYNPLYCAEDLRKLCDQFWKCRNEKEKNELYYLYC